MNLSSPGEFQRVPVANTTPVVLLLMGKRISLQRDNKLQTSKIVRHPNRYSKHDLQNTARLEVLTIWHEILHLVIEQERCKLFLAVGRQYEKLIEWHIESDTIHGHSTVDVAPVRY